MLWRLSIAESIGLVFVQADMASYCIEVTKKRSCRGYSFTLALLAGCEDPEAVLNGPEVLGIQERTLVDRLAEVEVSHLTV